MVKAIKNQRESMLVELGHIAVEQPELEPEVPPALAEVLEQYSAIFEWPRDWPLERKCNHTITLHPGAIPVSMRPHCYPHAQKNETEKLVQEMLVAGIIQVSTNPFSSLNSIGQTKQDDSWCFYVDYQIR